MIDLEERLHAAALAATQDLRIEDPSQELVELAPRRASSRRRSAQRGLVGATAAAAVVALVGIGVVSGTGDRSAPARVDAASDAASDAAEPTTTQPTTTQAASVEPAQRLRDAVAATLASESFRVRTVGVVLEEGGQPIEGVPHPSVMPLVFGSGAYGDTVWTVAGELVETTSTAGPARSVRDRSASTTTWEVAPGRWERATIDEEGVVEPLARFADFSCVAAGDQPDTLVVLAADAPCPPDLAHQGPRRLRWTVTLRPDGRIASIVPIRDQERVADARSDQLFGDYDTATVEQPDPAQLTEVPTPVGSSIDPATGYSRPMYTMG